MRQSIVELAIRAYTALLPVSWVALAAVVVVLLPMAAIRRTRAVAGAGLFLASYVFGGTTWFLGATVTFASFGWLGLAIGLLVFGIGVVPLAIIAAFFKLKVIDLGVTLIVMLIATFAARAGGAYLGQVGAMAGEDHLRG